MDRACGDALLHGAFTGREGVMVYRRKEKVVAREIAGETLLVPIRGNLADMQKLFVLDEVGKYVWDMLDGKNTLSDVSNSICADFKVDPEEAGCDVKDFITDLQGADLVEEVA